MLIGFLHTCVNGGARIFGWVGGGGEGGCRFPSQRKERLELVASLNATTQEGARLRLIAGQDNIKIGWSLIPVLGGAEIGGRVTSFMSLSI